MMPKVRMKAPPGLGGQVHASASGRSYVIDPNGELTVDAVDVSDLHGAGFVTLLQQGDPNTPLAAPITSPSLTADTEGAHALDPDARDANRREVEFSPGQTGTQQNQDFGGAAPPHGIAREDGGSSATRAHTQADADLERQAAQLAGRENPQPSAVPNTGHPNNVAASKRQQEQAADPNYKPDNIVDAEQKATDAEKAGAGGEGDLADADRREKADDKLARDRASERFGG